MLGAFPGTPPKRCHTRVSCSGITEDLMGDDHFRKPLIGVASSWNEVTPCNLHLDKLADRAKAGVREAGGYPIKFTTIAVSDGISMGTEGMRASLISRECIADSVEVMVHAER